jgi:hypothetical protein
MPLPLPEDIKRRAEQMCEGFGYLKVYDPGSWFTANGMTFVWVHDDENRGLWISWSDKKAPQSE